MTRYGTRVPRDFDIDAHMRKLHDVERRDQHDTNVELSAAAQAMPMRPSELPRLLESQIKPAVFAALEIHPLVAFVWRANSGKFDIDGRYFGANFTGCSDYIGMLRDARFLAVEVKREGEYPTPDQARFLDRVRANGGVAFVARGVDDVLRELAAVGGPRGATGAHSER